MAREQKMDQRRPRELCYCCDGKVGDGRFTFVVSRSGDIDSNVVVVVIVMRALGVVYHIHTLHLQLCFIM